MKKVLLFILILSAPVWAQKDVSVGAFGGLNIPIVQEDAGSGSDFGVKAKFSPMPMIAGAAFFEARTFGDASITVGTTEYTTGGGNVTSFGVEALIGNTGGGPGPHFYWALGISSYKWTRDSWEDVSEVGYHIGPGIEMIFPANIGLEIRGKFEIVPTD
ncbi:MAG: hypothetical protein JSU85_05165, partial [Candidatus Zixiibacteriota bacterium]